MIPNHILHEIAHRCRTAHIPTADLARSLGIDPDAAPFDPGLKPRLPRRSKPPMNEGPVVRGAVHFDLSTTCLGRTYTIDCRATYVLTLDDHDLERGRAISRIASIFEILEWRDLNHFDPVAGEHQRLEAPSWEPAPLGAFLHPLLLREIQDLAEEQVRPVEAARLSAR